VSSSFTVQFLGIQFVNAKVFFFSSKTTATITAIITAITILMIAQVATSSTALALCDSMKVIGSFHRLRDHSHFTIIASSNNDESLT
jgi:hypothetical protein